MPIIDIFSEAIEIADPDERMAFVEQACEGDATRHQQVITMLEQYYDPTTFMAGPAIDAGTLDNEDGSETLLSEKPGDRIGRYKLLEKIGEGGMGLIYMAEQQEPVVRRVALKIIKWGMDTKQVLARFEVERQALALMNHPNIAKILDAGSTETGRSYFVMELVQGSAITDFCNQYKLSPRERLSLFTNVCSAVQHAHQKGIIHRDIKPSNVLVTRIDDQPIAKVIDFGVAKATQQRLTDKTLFTQFQQFIGTPAYMSPEQAQTGAQDIDTRSDIYSMGVLLYELLTGRPPFSNQELISGGFDEIRRRVCESEPLSPSKKLSSLTDNERTEIARRRQSAPATLKKTLRGELDWVIMKALEKDPARRFKTADSFRLDIERYLNDEPVSAAAPSAIYKFQKFAIRNRFALGTSIAFALLLISGIISTSILAYKESKAVAKLQTQTTELKLANQRADERTLLAQRHLYGSKMNFAFTAVKERKLGRASFLLEKNLPQKGTTDFRGWEWRYLWSIIQPESTQILPAHIATVSALCYSPNGSWLASGDGPTVKLWDTERYDLLTSKKFEGYIAHLDISRSGKHLAAGFLQGEIRILTLPELAVIDAFDAEIRDNFNFGGCLSFSSNEPFLYYGLTNGVIRSRNLDTKNDEFLVQAHEGGVQTMAVSDDGIWLASAGDDQKVKLWKVDAQQRLSVHDVWKLASAGTVFNLTYSPNGRFLACGGRFDGSLKVLDISTMKEIDLPQEQVRWVKGIDFSPEGDRFFSSGTDQSLRIWDTTSWKELARLQGHREEISTLAVSAKGEIATGGKDRSVRIWDSLPKKVKSGPRTLVSDFQEAVSAPDQTIFATSHENGLVKIWDSNRLKVIEQLFLEKGETLGGVSSNEKLVASNSSPNGQITIRSYRSKEKLGSIPGTSAVFSRNGEALAVAANEMSSISIHSLPSMAETARLSWDNEVRPLEPFCFSQSGDRLLTVTQRLPHDVSSPQRGILWNIKTQSVMSEFPLNHQTKMTGFRFNPMNSQAVSVGYDGKINVWDLSTDKFTYEEIKQDVSLNGLGFTLSGERYAVTTGANSVLMFDASSNQEIGSIHGYGGVISDIHFSSDGNNLIVFDMNRSVVAFPAPSFNQIDRSID